LHHVVLKKNWLWAYLMKVIPEACRVH
jgi:hypothetical protein